MFKKILVGIDGGAPATEALTAAVNLAKQIRAELGILHVIDVVTPFQVDQRGDSERELAERRREGAELMSRLTVDARRFIVEGDPSDSIITTAREWGADLIVLGSDSRGRLAHFLLGSTADSVIRRAPCPVMTVRPQQDERSLPAVAATAVVGGISARGIHNQ